MGVTSFLTRLVLGARAAAERRARRMLRFPDRRLMAQAYIPTLAREGGRILWVGCQEYTSLDYEALEQDGAEVWTLEIDPAAARWGRAGRHRTGDVCEADAIFGDLRFDAVICNGVLGYGVDRPDQQRKALVALAAVLRPGGRLLLGWNTDRIASPVAAGLTTPWFEPAPLAGQPAEVTFAQVTHVYNSLSRRG